MWPYLRKLPLIPKKEPKEIPSSSWTVREKIFNALLDFVSLFLFSNICRFECLFSQIQTTGSYLGGTMTRVTKWIDAPFCRQSKLKLFAQNQVFSNRDFSFSTTYFNIYTYRVCTFQSFYNARFRVNLEHSCDFYSVNTEYKNCIVSEIFGV